MTPLTPPDCDLRDFPKMMIDIGRIFASSFNAAASRHPLAWMVGHKLWYRSWHQKPAASLPDDDEELSHLAELGLDVKTFRSVKALAMRGWVKCDDGRLYHKVIAAEALEAWIRKLTQRIKSNAGNHRQQVERAKKKGFALNIPAPDERPIQTQINVALDMLKAIDPQSKGLRRAYYDIPQTGPIGVPTGTPTGSPTGTAQGTLEGAPRGSQGTETGTETGREESPSQNSAEVVHLGSTRAGAAA